MTLLGNPGLAEKHLSGQPSATSLFPHTPCDRPHLQVFSVSLDTWPDETPSVSEEEDQASCEEPTTLQKTGHPAGRTTLVRLLKKHHIPAPN